MSVTMTSVFSIATIMLGLIYCQYRCDMRKERRAQAVGSSRQSSVTTTNQVADANNQTDVAIVVDPVLSFPPYWENKTKGKIFFFLLSLNKVISRSSKKFKTLKILLKLFSTFLWKSLKKKFTMESPSNKI